MKEPLSTSCGNTGFDDRWTCPACYADHYGNLDGRIVKCGCGHAFKARLDSLPVCNSELIAAEGEG